MKKNELIYDVRERLNAISDDRNIDDRLIWYHIKNARAFLLRRLMSRDISFSAYGLNQDHYVKLEPASRSLISGITTDCKVLRSANKLPEFIYVNTYGAWLKVRTIDVLNNTVELIESARAPWVTFEFPIVYAFIDNGYLYVMAPKNDMSIEQVVITGVFKNPEEVDSDGDGVADNPDDIPITSDVYMPLMDIVVKELMPRIAEDPVNNSEPDYGRTINQEETRARASDS